MLISELQILKSLSFAIQDHILIMGNMYGNFTTSSPDTATEITSGKYQASKRDWIYWNPANGDPQYYQRLSQRLERLNSADNFNSANLILPAQVIAPNNSGVTFNYKTGEVFKSDSVTPPMQVSYSYKKVRVLTSWPENLDQTMLPTMALNSYAMDGRPFAIGTDAKNLQSMYFIEVWAQSDAQRSFLNSLLEQGLRVDIPLVNFEAAHPLTLNGGAIDPSFDPVAQRLRFLRVERFKVVNLPQIGTNPVERYRSSSTLVVSLIL